MTQDVTLAVRSERSVPWSVDVAGLAWVIAAGVAVMLPALLHGVYLGEFDWLAVNGLPLQHGSTIPNSDRILQMIPWTQVAWAQVHQGHLPLWNPYNVMGTPLVFNWQSSAFSLPALLGYLVPMRLAYTVQVLVTLVVAGSGAYVLGRVLRLTPVACVFAATVFELSGSFMGWLGWPVASVVSWSGWIFAATILVVRGQHRVRSIVLLSATLALAVYAGQPDTFVLLGVFVTAFALALLVQRAMSAHRLTDLRRPLGDLVVAASAGVAISAPLLLPGLQLMSKSIRSTGGSALGSQRALPISTLTPLIFPGLGSSPPFWVHFYLGVGALSLALVAVILTFLGHLPKSRRPEVVALVAAAIATGLLSFAQPVVSVMNSIPGLQAVRFPRAVTFFEFSLAILAGLGLDLLIRLHDRRVVLVVTGTCFLAIGVLLAALQPFNGVYSRGQMAWSVSTIVLGLAVVGILAITRASSGLTALSRRAGQLAGIVLLVFESTFLVAMGGPVWPSSPTSATPTAAERELQQAVGSSLVGSGLPSCSTVGFTPNSNIFFGIHEMMVYDPMLPRSYFETWLKDTGQVAGLPSFSSYCPGFTTAAEARTYGVSFVLEVHGSPGPKGAVYVKEIGGQDLYRVPGTAMATLTPAPSPDRLPANDASGSPVPASWSSPNSLRITTTSPTLQVLRVRLTDVPGWHATIDGRPLALESFNGVMLQARLPSGRHIIALTYWPNRFTVGIALAVVGSASLVALMIIAGFKKRRTGATRGTQPSATSSATSSIRFPNGSST